MERFREDYQPNWSEDSVRMMHTPSKLAKNALFYMQEVGNFSTHPGYYTERSHMNSFLMLYTTDGAGCLHYAGRKYDLLPGTLMWIDCMLPHRYEIKGTVWDFIWLHFNGATSREYYKEFARKNPPVVQLPAYTLLPNCIKSLIVAGKQPSYKSEILSSRLIVNAMTELLCLDPEPKETPVEIPDLISNVARYIENRFNEPIVLDTLSTHFSLSKFHLAREFKRYIGFAPGEYLILCRINEAKNLLKNTDMPVRDIAKAVGVENESHFSNLFRRKMDMTPRQFRKMWKNRT
ncbi:MAG: AraC family transcriptional regulator [Candidatus Howiella sp.]|jgi:AraC-like DNA-binding protein